MFLTADEIARLTGKRRPSAQVRILERRGYKVGRDGLGRPVVAIAEVNRKLVGGSAVHHEPDYEAANG